MIKNIVIPNKTFITKTNHLYPLRTRISILRDLFLGMTHITLVLFHEFVAGIIERIFSITRVRSDSRGKQKDIR